MPPQNPLAKRFKAERHAYQRLRKQTLAKVVRWEYWSDFHWHWNPSVILAKQLDNRAWWKKHPPRQTSKEEAYYRYGFDSAGRVVFMSYGSPEEPREEHFIRYSADSFAASEFYKRELKGTAEAGLSNGRPVYINKVGYPGERACMTIRWDEDRPVQLRFAEYGGKAELEWLFTKAGKLIGMYDLPRKLPRGMNLKSLSETIRERLLALVPKAVAKCRIKQPAYCLVLGYDGEGNGAMPPVLSIGLEAERKAFLKQNAKSAKSRIWNPEEFRHRLPRPLELPEDKKLEKACEWHNRILADKGSDAPARELLNRIAKELAALPWEKWLPTTGDFVVFAVDLEGADLRKNMQKSVSAALLKSLKSRKLL